MICPRSALCDEPLHPRSPPPVHSLNHSAGCVSRSPGHKYAFRRAARPHHPQSRRTVAAQQIPQKPASEPLPSSATPPQKYELLKQCTQRWYRLKELPNPCEENAAKTPPTGSKPHALSAYCRPDRGKERSRWHHKAHRPRSRSMPSSTMQAGTKWRSRQWPMLWLSIRFEVTTGSGSATATLPGTAGSAGCFIGD